VVLRYGRVGRRSNAFEALGLMCVYVLKKKIIEEKKNIISVSAGLETERILIHLSLASTEHIVATVLTGVVILIPVIVIIKQRTL